MDSSSSQTILIVDDNPTNLQTLLACLQHAHYKVLVATDGESALKHAERGRPDLILLDILMPGMDGFETCRYLKQIDDIQDVPILFMTALSETVNKLNGFAAGGVDYLVKPLEHEEVLARVQTHLRLRQLQHTLEAQNLRLQKSTGELRTINTALTRFLQNGDIHAACKVLLDDVLAQTGSPSGLLGSLTQHQHKHDADKQTVEFLAIHGEEFRDLHRTGPVAATELGDGFIQMLESGYPLRENQLLKNEHYDAIIAGFAVDHFLGVPIKKEAIVIGFIAVANRPGGYSAAQQLEIDQFVQSAGILLECEYRRQREARSEQKRMQAEATVHYLQEKIKTQEVQNFGEIIGTSSSMRNVLDQAERVAMTDSTVIIFGETGTGKELIARAMHDLSARRDYPMVTVNCAALPESLVESELFGHEKGAFTGATAQRKGRFELAHGGTLFLDEIGDMPLVTQSKLLRALQERKFERVGGSQTVQVNVRIFAATHHDLHRLVENNMFRQDLFYRLNIFPIQLPPLRERRQDIAELACYFAQRFATRLGRPFAGISERALLRLDQYDWPGNIRELENVIERAVTLSNNKILDITFPITNELPTAVKAGYAYGSVAENTSLITPQDQADTLDDIQRSFILTTLNDTGWLIEGPRGAAKRLGLKPSTLRNRMVKLGIRRPVGET